MDTYNNPPNYFEDMEMTTGIEHLFDFKPINFSKFSNVVFSGKYPDRYIESGDYADREMNDEEIDHINRNHSDFIHELYLENR